MEAQFSEPGVGRRAGSRVREVVIFISRIVLILFYGIFFLSKNCFYSRISVDKDGDLG